MDLKPEAMTARLQSGYFCNLWYCARGFLILYIHIDYFPGIILIYYKKYYFDRYYSDYFTNTNFREEALYMKKKRSTKFNQAIINLILNKIRHGKLKINGCFNKLSFYAADTDEVDEVKDNNNNIFKKKTKQEKRKIKIKSGIVKEQVTTDRIFRIKIVLSEIGVIQNSRCYHILKKAGEIGQLYNSLSVRGIVEVSEIINEINLIMGANVNKNEIKQVFINLIEVYEVKVEELADKDTLAYNNELGKSYGLL